MLILYTSYSRNRRVRSVEAKNKFCERFVTVHGILQSGGWGGNEQGKGDFAGQLSPKREKKVGLSVWLLIAPRQDGVVL